MELAQDDHLFIKSQNDIVTARQKVRAWSLKIGFSLIDQTKVITAASELARNTLEYGGGGEMKITLLKDEKNTPGLKIVFSDQGPGISNVKLALTDGYSTGKGMGLGLSGSKRLMNEFNLETELGKGTRVTIVKWK